MKRCFHYNVYRKRTFIRLFLLFVSSFFLSCTEKPQHKPSVIFASKATNEVQSYDLPQILESGVLIGITLSGPDTYYEYRGESFGTQFLLAQDFAQKIGVKLQMEVASDTAALLQQLHTGAADIICLDGGKGEIWETRPQSPLLAKALREWWSPERNAKMVQNSQQKMVVRRRSRPLMKDPTRGIISAYDNLFITYSKIAGWDWRLLAAQCYQESAFDPYAVSWVGAKGLMQLMPSTANELGVHGDAIFNPESNIAAATRYIRKLNQTFSDIKDPHERIHFILAAYNGGALHIRDAMTLARNDGYNEYVWQEVSPYILRLTDPKYYRRPEVKHGYMRGDETESYVRMVIQRWQQYRRSARAFTSGSIPTPSKRNIKDGKFQSKVKQRSDFDTVSIW